MRPLTPMDIIKIVVLIILVVILGVFGYRTWKNAATVKTQAQTIDAQNRTSEATSDIGGYVDDARGGQVAETQRIIETRVEYRTRYEELKHEDPTVAQYDATPVPLQLRRLACQRRLARHGPGGDGLGCEYLDGAAPAAR